MTLTLNENHTLKYRRAKKDWRLFVSLYGGDDIALIDAPIASRVLAVSQFSKVIPRMVEEQEDLIRRMRETLRVFDGFWEALGNDPIDKDVQR